MRNVPLVCVISLTLFSPVWSQNIDNEPVDELAFLRLQLKAPQATTITFVPNAATSLTQSARLIPEAVGTLPIGIAHRVYIDVGDRKELRANLITWVDKWNRKEGKKHGKLEVVTDISQADVILARYLGKEIVYREGPGGRRFVRSLSYVIIRKPEGLEVLWRSYRKIADVEDPGIGLWAVFSTMLGAPLIMPPP